MSYKGQDRHGTFLGATYAPELPTGQQCLCYICLSFTSGIPFTDGLGGTLFPVPWLLGCYSTVNALYPRLHVSIFFQRTRWTHLSIQLLNNVVLKPLGKSEHGHHSRGMAVGVGIPNPDELRRASAQSGQSRGPAHCVRRTCVFVDGSA